MLTGTATISGRLPCSWHLAQSALAGFWWWQIWQPRGGSKVSLAPVLLMWQVRQASFLCRECAKVSLGGGPRVLGPPPGEGSSGGASPLTLLGRSGSGGGGSRMEDCLSALSVSNGSGGRSSPWDRARTLSWHPVQSLASTRAECGEWQVRQYAPARLCSTPTWNVSLRQSAWHLAEVQVSAASAGVFCRCGSLAASKSGSFSFIS